MEASTTPKRKRNINPATPPQSPAIVNTTLFHNQIPRSTDQSDTYQPYPNSPRSAVASSLSSLSIRAAVIQETPEQSPSCQDQISKSYQLHTRYIPCQSSYMNIAKDDMMPDIESKPESTSRVEANNSEDDAMAMTPPHYPDVDSSITSLQQSLNNGFSSYYNNDSISPPHVYRHSVPPASTPVNTPLKRLTHSPPPQSRRSQSPRPQLEGVHNPTRHLSPFRRPYSPMPAKEARSPSPSSQDPEDDGTGLNGIGYKPTPQIAYARAQKRKQQLMDWKLRETREARQRRSERRAGGTGGVRRRSSVELSHGLVHDLSQRRVVRFA